jgi:hypothetical protein
MKFFSGFRTAYWLVLVGMLTWFLHLRLGEAVAGHANAADTIVFAVWVALLLAPLFSEVELLGVKLKREVEKAKDDIKREIVSLKTEISSAIDVRTHVSPNIYLSPPPDAQLPAIEAQIQRAVEQALATRHAVLPVEAPAVRPVDGDVDFLFRTRRDLEIELRRLARERQLPSTGHQMAGTQLARLLSQADVLEQDLLRAVREVYTICSPAVHGEDVTQAQVAFVRKIGPELVAALQSIH